MMTHSSNVTLSSKKESNAIDSIAKDILRTTIVMFRDPSIKTPRVTVDIIHNSCNVTTKTFTRL